MSPDFQALCYLAAWEKGLPFEGGIAFEAQLRKCRLDYSWSSLDRIDYFLDALCTQRKPAYEDFLARQQNVNLLVFLAFYVVELRARVIREPYHWTTYAEAVAKDPTSAGFGEGFHSFLIAEQLGTQFLPLSSICSRLFDETPDKSVAFSAGLFIQPPADTKLCLPSLPPRSMIADFYEKYHASDIPAGYKRWFEAPFPSDFPEGDELARLNLDAPKLLRTGCVVWGAIVQANTALFDPTYLDHAPGEVVYDPLGKVDRFDLHRVASRLLELRNETPIDPALETYSRHLKAERTRIFGWSTPPSMFPYPLLASTTIFQSKVNFPGYMMAGPFFPILVSDECPGSVMIAPWQLWPDEVLEEWNDMIRTKYGPQFVPRKESGLKLEPRAMPAPRSEPDREPEYQDSSQHLHTMESDSDDEEASPLSYIAIGLILLGIAWFLHSVLTNLEQSGGSIRINWIVALLYKALGKWGACGLFAVPGAIAVFLGVRDLRLGNMSFRTALTLAALAILVPLGIKSAGRSKPLPPDLAAIPCPDDHNRHASTTFGSAKVLFICIPESHADKPKLLRCVGENGFDVMPNMLCEDSGSLPFLRGADGSIRIRGSLHDEKQGSAQIVAVFGVKPWPSGQSEGDDPKLWPDAQEILPSGFRAERILYCHEQASRSFGDGYASCLVRARSASLHWQFHITLKIAPGQDVDEEDYKRELRFITKYLAQLVTDPA